MTHEEEVIFNTAKDFWKEKFDEAPKANADKLAVALMVEFAKDIKNALISEIQRRNLMIKSEPDGIVRETMINNLLLDL